MRQTVSDSITSTVQDLYESGLIDEATLKNIKNLCLPEMREYTPQPIVKIRKKLKLSQNELACLFNVSPLTVRNWEKGYKKPSGSSVNLLNLAEKKRINRSYLKNTQ